VVDESGPPVDVSTCEIPVEGLCDSAFAAVEDAFRENFRARGEIGAAVCVLLDGRAVVDLWGGHCETERLHPWRRDTLVNAYSVGKGITSMLALSLVERGELDLDRPVARDWPGFAANARTRRPCVCCSPTRAACLPSASPSRRRRSTTGRG